MFFFVAKELSWLQNQCWQTGTTEWPIYLGDTHRRFSCLRTIQTWLTELLQVPGPWKRLLWSVVLRGQVLKHNHAWETMSTLLPDGLSVTQGMHKGLLHGFRHVRNTSLSILLYHTHWMWCLYPCKYLGDNIPRALCVRDSSCVVLWSCSQATSLSRLEASHLTAPVPSTSLGRRNKSVCWQKGCTAIVDLLT